MSTLSPVSATIAKGKTLAEMMAGFLKPTPPAVVPKVALAARLTIEDRQAIAELMEVFGSVNPQERVAITPAEVASIMGERLKLDAVLTLLEKRKEGIRTTILNHLDVLAEEAGLVDSSTPLDKDGHYLVANKAPASGTHKVFAWEVSPGKPTFNVTLFYEMCHTEGTGLTHKDWLACSFEPEIKRQFSEDRAISHLQAHPELLEILAQAMEPATPRGALNVRKEQ